MISFFKGRQLFIFYFSPIRDTGMHRVATQEATSMNLSFALSSEPRILMFNFQADSVERQGFRIQWSRYLPREASLPFSAKRNRLQRPVDGV